MRFKIGDTVMFAKWWAIGQGIWPYVKEHTEYRAKVIDIHHRNLITIKWRTGEIHSHITGGNLEVC